MGRPSTLPWWVPFAALSIILILAAIALWHAPEADGSPPPDRCTSVCRCGARPPLTERP